MSRQREQSVSFDELVSDAEEAPRQIRRSAAARWASFFSGLLLTLTVLAAPLAMAGWWVEHDLLDADAFVADNADLINNADVRDAIATKATNTVTSRLELPAGAQSVIGDQVKSSVREAIDAALAPDAMQQTWQQLLRASHAQNVSAMRGETEAADGAFALQLSPLADQVRTHLEAANPLLGGIVPETDITMSIGPTGSIDKARPLVEAVDRYSTPLIIAVSIALVAGVTLATGGRMRALSRVATWLVVAAAATFALARAGAWLMANLLQRQLGDAGQPLFTSVTMPLQVLATVIGAAALVVALGSRVIVVVQRRRR